LVSTNWVNAWGSQENSRGYSAAEEAAARRYATCGRPDVGHCKKTVPGKTLLGVDAAAWPAPRSACRRRRGKARVQFIGEADVSRTATIIGPVGGKRSIRRPEFPGKNVPAGAKAKSNFPDSKPARTSPIARVSRPSGR